MVKTFTLSIVIPVYDEEGYLKSCLDSIAAQTIMPDEVIVVDNNSTDRSMKIAKRYKFVKILSEKRQHQVFAQVKGFNSAKSDILGRIDADSVLEPDWVGRVKAAFNDPKTVAITGGAIPYDVPMKWLSVAIFHFYMNCAGLIAGRRMIWGANCALRRTAWQKIQKQTLLRPDIWEDYDLGFCLAEYGKVRYLTKINVGVSLRSMHTSFTKHTSYQFRAVRTFFLRTGSLQTSLFFLLWTTSIIIYPLIALDDWLQRKRDLKPKPESINY